MTEKIHVLVEGQSEDTFVRNVLEPHLTGYNVHVIPIIIKTKRVGSEPSFKGGTIKYRTFKKQIFNLLNDTSARLVTTMLDLFGLPSDFPGMTSMTSPLDPIDKASILENSMLIDINNTNFLPYIQVHEFEALVLVDPEKLCNRFPDDLHAINKARKLVNITQQFNSPEHVNGDNPPSYRILNEFPTYKKVSHGFITIKEIGMEKLKASCSHFNSWISILENMAI